VIVVSEETGAVSLAVEGHMERVDGAQLRDRLASLLGLARTGAPRSLLAGVRRLTARSKA
jgi:hypothetical protein